MKPELSLKRSYKKTCFHVNCSRSHYIATKDLLSILIFTINKILCCKIESLPGVIRKCPRTLSAQLFSRLYQSMCEGDLHAKLFLSAKTRIENVEYKTCMGFTGGRDLLAGERKFEYFFNHIDVLYLTIHNITYGVLYGL